MAFWNRKKEESTIPIQSLFDSGAIKELEKAIRQSTESTDKATAATVRSFQEMTKALNNATKEFKRSRP